MWVLGLELASCHANGAYDLPVVPIFLENLLFFDRLSSSDYIPAFLNYGNEI